MDRIVRYLDRVAELVRLMNPAKIQRVSDILLDALYEGKQVFLFGNGGSAATASHFAVDLGKGLKGPRGLRLKAHCLVDGVPMMTAIANDTDFSRIFGEQLVNFVRPKDIVIAISGSGNSPNILNGLTVATERGAFTIGLTGFQGGKLKNLVDICIIVPSDNMQQIEDVHMVLTHVIYTEIHETLALKVAEIAKDRPKTQFVPARIRPIPQA